MPNIGDFAILSDGAAELHHPTGQGQQNFWRTNFTLPNGMVNTQRSILQWKIGVKDPDDLKYEVWLNNTKIMTATHDVERYGTVHEVVGVGVLKTENSVQFVATDGTGLIKISDVVLFFQHTV